jgi:type II secretory ATPase GspE/PulE/Tfp pilus assembly ATPase PilB-like protein
MPVSHKQLKKWLVSPGHISEEKFKEALEEALSVNLPLESVLVNNELITDNDLGRSIAYGLGYRYLDLSHENIDEEIFSMLPKSVMRGRGVILVERTKDGIKAGMRDPLDIETKHLIEKRIGEQLVPYYVTSRTLDHVLAQHKEKLSDAFSLIVDKIQSPEIGRKQHDEAIVQMVDTLIQYGYDSRTSDVHIEPYEKLVIVRFRIDGVLHDMLELPKELLEPLLSRIKILARMRIDEHRAAQDGKFRFHASNGMKAGTNKSSGEIVDVRVSIVPITNGEKAVLRLLASVGKRFALTDLGFRPNDFKKVESALVKPHGMFLVTGPTGSGKTTTVYGMLKRLNQREVNVATIEDPVEYDISGVNQIQVNPKTNLTFAKGLRAVVRQDPDVIMVGEIRDQETAGIAVNSAMTGHLVLSTLHANDAATTLPRLLDMGIEPFLVASTINVIIAQRLVRTICKKCRASHALSKDEKILLAKEPTLLKYLKKRGHKNPENVTFFKGESENCNACGHTGYEGRVGIFEVLEMSENIKELVLRRASSDEVKLEARKEGMSTMLEDGIEKALQGITTLDEVLRVTKA